MKKVLLYKAGLFISANSNYHFFNVVVKNFYGIVFVLHLMVLLFQ